MKIGLTVILLFLYAFLKSQDSSNIIYYKPNNIDSSLIGKYCHIDYGENSFRCRTIDTTEINVNGQMMKFYEHREDNGFNNWFDKQYLIRVEDKNQTSTRLQDSRIDSITMDRIYLTIILSYYINESPIDTITVFQHSYNRKNIANVLIKK